MESIVAGLHRLSLGLVNVYFLETEAGLILIDTGFPGNADKILVAARSLGYFPKQLKHIILTHAHPDHVGSAAALVRLTGAQTWMHELDVPIVPTGSLRPTHAMPGLKAKFFSMVLHLLPRNYEPFIVDHIITGRRNEVCEGVQAIHCPGHCAGQIALYLAERRTLIAADICVNIRGLRQPLVNEDRRLGEETLRNISELDFDIACFGHGPTITTGASSRFRQAFQR